MAAIAEFYSDNLGQEVRKGMQQKLRNGGWPNLAPVGYVNTRVDQGGRRAEAVLTIDPEQAPLVRKAFELYASGEHTITSLHEQMTELGLRNKRGAPMSRSKLAAMLHNKLYAGIVVFNGVEYAGAHEPLVSLEWFDRTQVVFSLHDRDKVRERKAPSLPARHRRLRIVWVGDVFDGCEGPQLLLLVLLLPRAIHRPHRLQGAVYRAGGTRSHRRTRVPRPGAG